MRKILYILFHACCKMIAVAGIINFSLLIAVAQPPTQEWVARYSGTSQIGSSGLSVKQDSLGFIYVLARTYTDSTFTDYCVLKYTQSGTLLWSVIYNTPGLNDNPEAMAISPKGDVYVTGNSDINFTTRVTTIKLNTSGTLQWARVYNGASNNDEAYDIKLDKSNNIIIVGSAGDGKALTIKYNSDGDSLWVRKFTQLSSSSNFKLCLDDSNNIYTTGVVLNPTDILNLKYNSDGILQWYTRYNSPQNSSDFGECIALDLNRNVYVVGRTAIPFSLVNNVLIKINNIGIIVWSTIFKGLTTNNGGCWIPKDMVIENSGNSIYYTTMCTNGTGGGGYDLVTLKYNSIGDSVWVRRFFGGVNATANEPSALKLDKYDNVYVCGRANFPITGSNFITIKYSPQGNQLWSVSYTGLVSNSDDAASDMFIDTSSSLYVTGRSTNLSDQGYDATTIKYSQIIGITTNQNEIPEDWKLYQNFPNPFNSNTIINYQIPFYSNVNLILYDILGRKIQTLVNDFKKAGYYESKFDGTNFASGVYFYRIEAGDFALAKKMVLVK